MPGKMTKREMCSPCGWVTASGWTLPPLASERSGWSVGPRIETGVHNIHILRIDEVRCASSATG